MRSFLGIMVGLALLAFGCATNKVHWENRIGSYTFDQAVLEMGPPDKDAKLTDGTRVSEWLTSRLRQNPVFISHTRGGFITTMNGGGVDYYLRLTFDPTGKLQAFKKYAK